MGQVYIKVTWDQFIKIKEIIEEIKPLCVDDSQVEMHRGNIWVKGEKEELTITVELPGLVS